MATSLPRGISLCISKAGGHTCKENYACWSWEGRYVVMEINIVIAGGEGLVVWEIG